MATSHALTLPGLLRRSGPEHAEAPDSLQHAVLKVDEIWKRIVAKGQDLQCMRCATQDFQRNHPKYNQLSGKTAFFQASPMMPGSKRNELYHHTRFDEEMQDRWVDAAGTEKESLCLTCVCGHCLGA